MTDYREFQDGEVVPGTRYRITRLIGSGGMGRVYEVEHIELGKLFVLKALQRELSRREDLVARLRNEWRALARLEHPNIVNVTDAGTSENGVPFYVMERLEGEPLSALLHRQRRLLPQQALAIAAGILEGLHAAHQIGVVHRDVKPPNIFLSSTAIKVLDFGIAKIRDAKDVITARGIAVGTPRYMSPEQAQGTAVDARSDIYATGLMLFEMVAGVGPFDDAKDHNELLLAHLGRKAPLLSSISVVAPELDAVVASMLAKDPRERPGSARQVAETLRQLSQRYANFVDTQTPTVNAPLRGTTRSEPPTRVEGRRAAQPAPAATRPDGVAAFGRAATPGDTTVVQPVLERATTAAHVLPKPNVTQRLLPVPTSTPILYGPDTLVDPISRAPTAVPEAAPERTEMLLTLPLPPGHDLGAEPVPTRTSVPVVDAPNLTPPPVVPSLAQSPPGARSRWAAAAAGAAVLLLGVAVLTLRGRAAEPAPVSAAAAPNPKPPTPVEAARQPGPAVAALLVPPVVPVVPPPRALVAPAEPASAAAPAPSVRPRHVSKKEAPVVTGDRSGGAAPAPAKPHVSMPSSGL